MAKRPAQSALSQPVLFGDSPAARLAGVIGPAEPAAPLKQLAARLPATVHLGTSSWSFPGWGQLVWDRAASEQTLARSGLAAYAAHPLFRTVGLDRTFYAPMPEHELAELAAMTPPGFAMLVKAHQAITRPTADERGRTFGATGAAAGKTAINPLFLDATYAIERVIGPAVMGLGERLGPVVFQFPPMDLSARGPLGGVEAFTDRVEEFLARLPAKPVGPKAVLPLYAVEVRNQEVLTPRWRRMLRRHNAVAALAGHPSQPSMAQQAALLRPLDAPEGVPPPRALVVRWLLHPSQDYAAAKAKYDPFTKLVDADPQARGEIADLVVRAVLAGLPAWVVINNKAEGSAPLSVAALAETIAAALATAQGRDGVTG
jgi:uncharacterized protein YecE (DUF72 family)